MNEAWRQHRRLLAALLVYALCLTALTVTLDKAGFRQIFSESGIVERLSEPAWLLLALACLLSVRPSNKAVGVMGLVALFCAMREADWHYEFTGTSMLKLSYYSRHAAPLSEKIPAGAVALLALIILCTALYLAVRTLRRPGALSQVWLQTMLIGAGVGVGTKLLDRMINLIYDGSGYRIGGVPGRMIGGFEEGFEFALPLIFGLALWQYRRARQLSGEAAPQAFVKT